MSKVLVGTEERLRRLGKTYSGPPQNTALLLQGYRDGVNAAIAAMTEVDVRDLVDMLHAWRWEQEHGTRELRPFSDYILDRIKEGK